MSLEYEPSSEALHISAKQLFLSVSGVITSGVLSVVAVQPLLV